MLAWLSLALSTAGPPDASTRASGISTAVEWYLRTKKSSAKSAPPQLPSLDPCALVQISGRLTGLLSWPFPPDASTWPVGRMVRLWLARRRSMSPDTFQPTDGESAGIHRVSAEWLPWPLF